MKIENNTRQPLVINLGMDAQGNPKDIHIRARGYKGSSSRELTTDELEAPEVKRLLQRKKVRLLG